MTIKEIFDEITGTGGNNAKMDVLKKYVDNELLEVVLYMANSKRVKFYIKQIPEYTRNIEQTNTLEFAIEQLRTIANREITGNDALRFLSDLLSTLKSDDAYIVERIIDKDCKIGLGTTFMNKVFKGLIEETPYMGAVSFDEKKARKIFDKGGIGYSQIKMDGRYANAVIINGEVELESRQGEPTILTGAKFLKELSNFEDCVLNGELTIASVPRYESNGIIASLIDICSKRETRSEAETNRKIINFEDKHGSFTGALDSIIYTIWDTITPVEYFDKSSKTPYNERLALVDEYINNSGATMIKPIECKIVYLYVEAMEHFQEVLSTEVYGVPQEGTILKAYDGVWKDGKQSHQIKMKLEMDIDLRITGFNMGTKGTKNEFVVSSFNVESSDGLVKTRPQGLKEDMMKYITENQDNLLGKIIQVKCNGLSNDRSGNYSLLYPAFVGIRDDKDTCDSLESIKEIENMVKLLEK
jgi:ATP-dependent DNA ligase